MLDKIGTVCNALPTLPSPTPAPFLVGFQKTVGGSAISSGIRCLFWETHRVTRPELGPTWGQTENEIAKIPPQKTAKYGEKGKLF